MPRHPWGFEHPRASRWEGEAAGAPAPAWGCGLLHRGCGHCWGAKGLSDRGRLGGIIYSLSRCWAWGDHHPEDVKGTSVQGSSSRTAGCRDQEHRCPNGEGKGSAVPSLAGESPQPLHHLKQSRREHRGLGGQLIPRDAQWVTPGHIKAIPWLGLGSSGTHRALCSWLAPQSHTQHLPYSLSTLFLRIAWFPLDCASLVTLDNLTKTKVLR